MEIKISVQGELDTNSYMINDSKYCYIIDPVEKAKEIKNYIEKEKLQLQGVIITHFHLDHLKALSDYRDTKIYMSAIDYKNITTQGAVYKMRTNFYYPGYFTKNDEEILLHVLSSAKVIKIDDKSNIPFSEKLEVILTPGHTNGSICIYCAQSAALFAGDTVFYHSHGRTDLATGSTREILKSLKRISLLPQDTTIYPGHGNITSVKEEIENGVLRRFVNDRNEA